MATPNPAGGVPRPPLKLYDLDITVVSAKHLKNVNWKNGDLKPYAILWIDPDRRQATKPDDSGSTRPVWNERFVFSLTRDSILTLEIFHSKPSEAPKPLVGTLRFEIRDLLSNPDDSTAKIKSFELKRPSGRPHGKIRLKLALIERPVENYQIAPAPSYYYSSAPAPPPPPPPPRSFPQHGYRPYSPYSSPPPALSPPPQPYSYGGYSDPNSGYYSPYYAQPPPPPPPHPFFERESSYGGPGPSAPVDYTPYDYHKRGSGKLGAGLATGAVAGALGGLALEEGVKYEEEKVAERVENDVVSTSRDDRYSDYRSVY